MSLAKNSAKHVGNAILDKFDGWLSVGFWGGLVLMGFAAYERFGSSENYDTYVSVDVEVTSAEAECWWEKLKLAGGIGVTKTDRMLCDVAEAMDGSDAVKGMQLKRETTYGFSFPHPNGTQSTLTKPLGFAKGQEPRVGDSVQLFTDPADAEQLVLPSTVLKTPKKGGGQLGIFGLALFSVSWLLRRTLRRRRG